MKLIHLTLLMSLLLLLGCSLPTQYRSVSPHFEGELKFNNTPLKNTKILLSLNPKDTLCNQATITTKTDELGKFSLKAAKKEYSYTPFLDYQLNEWIVCTEHKGQHITLYSNNRYTTENITDSVVLDCDLSLRPLNAPCTVTH